jgi:hypothetical protein
MLLMTCLLVFLYTEKERRSLLSFQRRKFGYNTKGDEMEVDEVVEMDVAPWGRGGVESFYQRWTWWGVCVVCERKRGCVWSDYACICMCVFEVH